MPLFDKNLTSTGEMKEILLFIFLLAVGGLVQDGGDVGVVETLLVLGA